MPRTVAQIRSDPAAAGEVIDSVFERTRDEARDAYIEFLGESIEYLSVGHPDRWGVTLFESGLRLNVGWVECLVLSARGIRVLVERESAPASTEWDGVSYRHAPGCEMTTVPLTDAPRTLGSLGESHFAALSIAAKGHPSRSIMEAHSPGVIAYLCQALRRPIQNPSYAASAADPVLLQFGEEATHGLYSEGGRTAVMVNRYERDPRAREECIAHHGRTCSVCRMTFGERYGETVKDLIHVHHLVPLSDLGTIYQVDPIADLRPVCPNCHAVIHSVAPPMSIEQARALLSS
jgi:5-methylcytosine-specific restriction protein A